MASTAVCAVCGEDLGREAKRLRTVDAAGEVARVRLGVVKLLSVHDDRDTEKRLVRAFLRVLQQQRKGQPAVQLQDEDDPFVLRAARVLDSVVRMLRDEDDPADISDVDSETSSESSESDVESVTTTATVASAVARVANAPDAAGVAAAMTTAPARELGAMRLAEILEDTPEEAELVATKIVSSLRSANSSNHDPITLLEPLFSASSSVAFVEHFAKLGGLRELLRLLTRCPGDERAQICGLSILGHASLLTEHSIQKEAAERGVLAALTALSRFSNSPRVVGLAALAIANFAASERRAATAVGRTGACELLVDALDALVGSPHELRVAHTAGSIALAAIATAPTSYGSRVQLARSVVDAGALTFLDRARIDPRSAEFATGQIKAALDGAPPQSPYRDEDDEDEDRKCRLQ